MGLDMYLKKSYYIGETYDHRNIKKVIKITRDGNPIKIIGKISSIEVEVFYWRKANMIHHWFVENIQEGNDNGKTYDVEYDELMKLKEKCKEALESKDCTVLPVQEGFFFGEVEENEYYWRDILDTYNFLVELKEEKDVSHYTYRASW